MILWLISFFKHKKEINRKKRKTCTQAIDKAFFMPYL